MALIFSMKEEESSVPGQPLLGATLSYFVRSSLLEILPFSDNPEISPFPSFDDVTAHG